MFQNFREIARKANNYIFDEKLYKKNKNESYAN